jgi:hypothetical protein
VFLDREYPIARHLAAIHPAGIRASFVPYARLPRPLPQGFVPGVGALILRSKADLLALVGVSLLYDAAWRVLARCAPDRSWIAVLDSLPEAWAEELASRQVPGLSRRFVSGEPGVAPEDDAQGEADAEEGIRGRHREESK